MEASISEIHAYPLRPEGYAEPLFHDRKSKKQILEHFARSGWLSRASEFKEAPPKEALSKEALSKPASARNPSSAAITGTAVSEVLASWREVDRWWEPGGGVDVVWRLVEDHGGRQEIRAEPAPGCDAA